MNNEKATIQEEYPQYMQKIGQTTYIVSVHFSDTATETMGDKIRRLLRNEVVNM